MQLIDCVRDPLPMFGLIGIEFLECKSCKRLESLCLSADQPLFCVTKVLQENIGNRLLDFDVDDQIELRVQLFDFLLCLFQ